MPDRPLKDIAIEFLTLAARGEVREAYARHVAADFRHHNPWFAGDARALMEGMEANARQNPDKSLEVQRAFEDGSCVAVFSRVRQRPGDLGGAVVHIFRFDGTRKIVELWDVGQAVPAESVNEHGMF